MRPNQSKKNQVIFYDDYVELVIKNKKGETVGFCKVDKDDYELIKLRNWFLGGNYVEAGINGYTRRLHTILLDTKRGEKIDHKNRDSFDNRKSNLRVVDDTTNVVNTKKKGYRFVPAVRSNSKTWSVQFRLPQGGRINKLFLTEDEAKKYREYLLRKYRYGVYIFN